MEYDLGRCNHPHAILEVRLLTPLHVLVQTALARQKNKRFFSNAKLANKQNKMKLGNIRLKSKKAEKIYHSAIHIKSSVLRKFE